MVAHGWSCKHLLILAITFFCLAGAWSLPPRALAQGELIKVEGKGPVYIRADQVAYDEVGLAYQAQGQVEVIRGDTRLLADQVVLNSQTLVAEAEGGVRFITPGQVLTGQRMMVDLQSETGKVYDGQIFIQTAHYYLRGEEISKTGRHTYLVQEGEFTTCDGKNPDWTITGEEIQVTLEGAGTARNTAFRVRDWPVLWTPWVAFPARFTRQSGLLVPQMGNTERDGFVYSQPWFQTFGEDQDATFTVTYLAKRGVDLGVEYRYHLSPGSKGMVMLDYLPNDQAAQDLYEEGELAEPYDSRWWFRAKADQNLFQDTTRVMVDLDWVGDQDYLREFTFGHTGFRLTDDRFNRWFGRGLEPDTSLLRKNRVNLQRSWSSMSFNANFLYWDRSGENNDRIIQELPTLSLNATRQAVGNTGLYFQMDSVYHYYYRHEGSKGHIADVTPSVALPLNFNNYLRLEPTVTYRPRLYSVEHDLREDTDHSRQGLSQNWTAGINASTYVYRVFDLGSEADPLKIKHGLRPFVNWSYRPELDDEDTASLARRSVNRSNTFAYGLNNSFTYKIVEEDEVTGEMVPVYREFLRLNLAHSFDWEQYQTNVDGRYWGEVQGRLEFEPTERLYFQAASSWNLYDNRFSSTSAQLVAEDYRGDYISVDYINNYDRTHQVNTKLSLAITSEWSVGYINRKDLRDEIDFEQTYEVAYQGQCWGLKFLYTDQHFRQQGYWLVFTLGGFGEIFGYGRMVGEGELGPAGS
jgi:LPS-assembly protein